MRILKLAYLFALLIFISFSLQSCFGVPKAFKREFTEKHKAIPPAFGKEETTFIVVLRGRKSYDNAVKSAVKKYYKGDYVYLYSNKDSINAVKYADLDKYRYYFDYSDGSTYSATYSSGLSSSSTVKRFYVHDRLTNTRYQSGGETGLFGKALKAYMGNLEIKRKSFN